MTSSQHLSCAQDRGFALVHSCPVGKGSFQKLSLVPRVLETSAVEAFTILFLD